ncbi:sporulation protein [Paenibacillus elgii]|uniref:Sporulation protein n=1 Tax=Paenibacillus elgii TaxID=189691 RepID=A0A163Y3F5_9BACL|nr:spore protease YyaC [Paenibacillus elgii]KZE78837.1 sporulation protein [Paenibacillus elgii]MCM3273943.1 spore protease YyaC [Paenibacillus elgii]
MKLPFQRDVHKPKASETLKIMHSEANSIDLLSDKLSAVLRTIPAQQPIVIVCVGTDRSTGDALGPLVGSQLQKQGIEGLHLYGTLEHPVHAMNLNETLTTIQQHFNDPFVIAIDACLGQLTSVGYIQVGDGPVKPGAGVNKELPPVGHMHVTGIVNVGGFMEYFVLQNTRLSLVMSMAEVISKSFQTAFSGKRQWSPTSLVRID